MNSVANSREVLPIIRSMKDADIDSVAALEQVIFPDPWPRAAFVEQLKDDMWGALVAEADGEIVGYACYLLVHNESHLTNIGVAPGWRRKSVACKLLERILGIVTEHGCDILLLEVRPSNDSARAFYAKHGFRELYRRPNYYRRPVEDALVLVRYLEPTQNES
ncbi:ribosomal-protein-alanine N-acetyltransferase [candidate division GN15 bacterium]|uniref:Ribosomal-protein-alanine N-acetyltransferase n=1 Tax=candidate division GN15 bacterium TaxID=2072418 RepID=A0A855X2I4_9BACT|nr:MAG: ribosomal-protein-alanine N-acetyltransferase [candidate division GN15 bacterium]